MLILDAPLSQTLVNEASSLSPDSFTLHRLLLEHVFFRLAQWQPIARLLYTLWSLVSLWFSYERHIYFIIAGWRNKSNLRVEGYCSNAVSSLHLFRHHEYVHNLIQTTVRPQHLTPALFVHYMKCVRYKSKSKKICHHNTKTYSYNNYHNNHLSNTMNFTNKYLL